MEFLKGQVAIIAGATGGIGGAIAVELARQRAKLVLIGRSPERLQAFASNLREASDVRCYDADLTQEKQVEQLSKEVIRDFGSVNILVHSAGIICLGRIEKTALDALDSQYAANVRAPYLLTKAFLEPLKREKGQVVFINSTIALRSRANLAQYAATKHALKALADSLREEVNPAGVRVVSIFLGRTATPMQAEIFQYESREYHPELLIQPEDVAAVVLNCLTLKRTAEITDVTMRPLVKSY